MQRLSYNKSLDMHLPDPEGEFVFFVDIPMNTLQEVFLVEKGWIDPMENHQATGYKPYGFFSTEEQAKDFCGKAGFWTAEDCWQMQYGLYNGKMPKYRYSKLTQCSTTV